MRKMVATAMVTAMLAGCASVRYPDMYVIDAEPTMPAGERAEAALGGLAVREFSCAEYLCDGRIVYRPSVEQVGYYEYHRWATNLRSMITHTLADRVRAGELFASVAVGESGATPAFVMTGTVDRFEEVDRGGQVEAVCVVSAQIADVRTKAIVWSGIESTTVPVERRDVAGVVSSLSAAARTTVDRLVVSMGKTLQSRR